jgi:diguanylate cyclase (GGDEF)-like protein
MHKPEIPADDATRLDALHGLCILDTLPEERFDRLTRLASRLFDVPIALVSLVDRNRQWFKSCQGLAASETPRDISFCGHAILGNEIFVIPDAAADIRFHDNPLVTDKPHIRFYAGCPLSAPDGNKLGTLCIIDRVPREFDEDDANLLRDLAHMAEQELASIQLATTDALTQISNRRGFEKLSSYALEICQRLNKPASLLFFDMDLFKEINDNFGHAAGDQALTGFAQILREEFRTSDVLGRIGGDEFAVLLSDTGIENIDSTLSRLQQAVDQFNLEARRDYDIHYSVGAIEFDAVDHTDISRLMAAADKHMYKHKKQKRENHGTVKSANTSR